jgi:hypothetical protein
LTWFQRKEAIKRRDAGEENAGTDRQVVRRGHLNDFEAVTCRFDSTAAFVPDDFFE